MGESAGHLHELSSAANFQSSLQLPRTPWSARDNWPSATHSLRCVCTTNPTIVKESPKRLCQNSLWSEAYRIGASNQRSLTPEGNSARHHSNPSTTTSSRVES